MDSRLAKREGGLTLDAPEGRWKMAYRLLESGFLPKAINTPAKAFAVIQAGYELRIGPMQAIRSLHVIDGKVGMAAELMLGLCFRDIPGFAFEMMESGRDAARARARRNPQDAWFELRMTREEIPAQVKAKGPWKDYGAAMLRARLIAAICRVKGPDATAGMHTPDELGATTTIRDDGTEEVEMPAPNITVEHVGPSATVITMSPGQSEETIDEETGEVIEDNGGGADRLAQSEQGPQVNSAPSGATDSTAAPVRLPASEYFDESGKAVTLPMETTPMDTIESLRSRLITRMEELQHPAAVIAWKKKHMTKFEAHGHTFAKWAQAKIDLRIKELQEQIRAGHGDPGPEASDGE